MKTIREALIKSARAGGKRFAVRPRTIYSEVPKIITEHGALPYLGILKKIPQKKESGYGIPAEDVL